MEELGFAVSHDDLLGRDAEALREGPDELGAVRVGVVDERAHLRADQRAEPLRRPQGVDVGREIEDLPGGPSRGRGEFRDVSPVHLASCAASGEHRRRDEGGAEFGQLAGGPERVAGEAADPAEAVGRKEEGGEEGRGAGDQPRQAPREEADGEEHRERPEGMAPRTVPVEDPGEPPSGRT